MIRVRDLKKSYMVKRRSGGALAALASLFRPRYDRVQALDGISFDVAPGEIVGYIGPNGAGKSTTIKLLCGIIRPDSGTCLVNGRVPWEERKAHVARIGAVFGQRSQLWWDVPVADSFLLLRDIYGMGRDDYRASLEELTEAMGIGACMSMAARQLSLGMRMRCELAASLLHRPDILFLDEPTIGLDAPSKLAARAFIERMNRQRGTTVILTTHDVHDIEALAGRVILIGHGRILHDGPFESLTAGRGGGSLEAAVAEAYGELGIS
jgi:ABC-2 type transport system ATP-binding protein